MAINRRNEEGLQELICIEDTNFIFTTNFSGDPSRDNFGSDARRVNIIIPDPEQARDLFEQGFNVKETKPRENDEDFEPTYFVAANINYDSFSPPRIYLVSGNAEPVLMDQESVCTLDHCRIKNVNVTLNPYHNPRTNKHSLYIRTMYVEQDLVSDPFAARYWGN